MKRLLLILVLCLTTINLKANSDNCPDKVTYNSSTKRFDFYYAAGIPLDGAGNATYTKIELEISGGKGAGNTYFVNVISKSGKDIITDDAGGAIDGTSEVKYVGSTKHRITYFNGSKDLNKESGSKFLMHCYGNLPLVIKLKSFTYNGSVFNWATVSEINNLGFYLESSEDGKVWEPVAFISSKAPGGQSNFNINYSFNLQSKAPYWRLIDEDFNGIKTSHVIHHSFIEKPIRVFDLMGNEMFNFDSLHGIYYVLDGNKWSKKLF